MDDPGSRDSEWQWTTVRALERISVMCESMGCHSLAEFSFSADDPIRMGAYCEPHAHAEAFRAQLTLPPKPKSFRQS
jgi:hypothetical protein